MIYGWKRTKGAMPTHLFSSFNLRRGFFSHRKRAKGYLPVLLRNKRRCQFRFFCFAGRQASCRMWKRVLVVYETSEKLKRRRSDNYIKLQIHGNCGMMSSLLTWFYINSLSFYQEKDWLILKKKLITRKWR